MLPAQYVAPYRRRNKTDRADTKALLEADRAPDIQAVPVKSADQQAVQQLHSVREQLIGTRTAWINQARATLREQGIPVAEGANKLRRAIPAVIEDADNGLPDILRELLADIHESIQGLDERIARLERQLKAYQAADADAQRISTLPGVGLITSTAITSCVADVRGFDKARQFAASLGLTPREHSSGDQRHLGRIDKRGNRYLRGLLIHGARSAMTRMLRKARRGDELTAFEQWAVNTRHRVGFNKAVVALANKLARRIFALCRDQTTYQAEPTAPAVA
jgi:transposase